MCTDGPHFLTVFVAPAKHENATSAQIRDAESRGFLFNLTSSERDPNGTKIEKGQVTIFLQSAGTMSDPIRVRVDASGAVWDLAVEPRGGFYPNWTVATVIFCVVMNLAIALLCMWAVAAGKERQILIRWAPRLLHSLLLSHVTFRVVPTGVPIEGQKETDSIVPSPGPRRKMLPDSATRFLLRYPGKPYIQPFENAAIFFSDIVGYTSMAGDLSPLEVMSMLNEVYTQFDALAQKVGVYKVETIGDSYSKFHLLAWPLAWRNFLPGPDCCCHVNSRFTESISVGSGHLWCTHKVLFGGGCDQGGNFRGGSHRLHVQVPDNAGSLFTDTLWHELGPGRRWHSGNVYAQVCQALAGKCVVCNTNSDRMCVGRYCIFGDTVNMSSRMESTCIGGKFQTDVMTAKILYTNGEHGFKLVMRQRTGIQVKGKGKTKTFFIEEYYGSKAASTVSCRFARIPCRTLSA